MGYKANKKRNPYRKMLRDLGLHPDTVFLFVDPDTAKQLGEDPALLKRLEEQARRGIE